MKGLLTKDFALLMQRKRAFIFLAIWAIVMGFTTDASFVIGWLTIVAAIFSISSLAYDEYDNSIPFLMSLPVDGKTYAKEKYVFGFLCGIIAWVFGLVVMLAISFIRKETSGIASSILDFAVFIPIFMLMIDFSLPINLKFGSERGRMISIIIGGVLCGIIALCGNFISGSLDLEIIETTNALIVLVAFILGAIATLVSMKISMDIMERKEY